MHRHISHFCLRVVLMACIGPFALTSVPAPVWAGPAGESKTIVFVCLHGAVNSQMAAAYFNKAARARIALHGDLARPRSLSVNSGSHSRREIDARLAAPSWCGTCNEHAITWTNKSGAVLHV
jgi:hypothetical protein